MSTAKTTASEVLERLHMPERYLSNDSQESKVIYALSQIGKGSAEDVGVKVSELDPSIEPGGFSHAAEPILKHLCDQGIVTCQTGDNDVQYYQINQNTN